MNIALTYFSVFIFVAGIVLTVLTIDQHSKLSNKCVSKTVQTGFNIILMLSVMMIVVPLVQLFCHWGCGCQQKDLSYKWIVVILAVLLTTTSGVVLNGLNNDKTCDSKSAKSLMTGIIASGSILIFTLVFLPVIVPGVQSWWGARGSTPSVVSPSSSSGSAPSAESSSSDPDIYLPGGQDGLL
mgnify:CR=1 FL=1